MLSIVYTLLEYETNRELKVFTKDFKDESEKQKWENAQQEHPFLYIKENK